MGFKGIGRKLIDLHWFYYALGSAAAGGPLVAIIPIRTAEDFPNIGIIGIIGISYTFIGICHSGLVFIGILACFAIFCSKTNDLLSVLKVLTGNSWICIGFTMLWAPLQLGDHW